VPVTGGWSSGKIAGENAIRRIDLDGLRRVFPDRWSAFCRAHFMDETHLAFVMGGDHKTARNWWNGITAPRAEAALGLAAARPDLAPIIIGLAA